MATIPDIIKLDDLSLGAVVNGEWIGEGVFDRLMLAVDKNIGIQYDKGRIKGADYANVYLGSMQSVLSESVRFLLEEKQAEYRIADIDVGIDIKNSKLAADRNLEEAQLEKQWGYDAERDPVTGNVSIVRDASDEKVENGNGKIDNEINLVKEQLDTEKIKQSSVAITAEDEHGQSIAIKDGDGLVVGDISDSAKVTTKHYNSVELIKEQKSASISSTALNIDKFNADKDDKENHLELDRNKNHASLVKEWGFSIERTASGDVVILENAGTGKIDEEIKLVQEKLDTEELAQLQTVAKVRDEHGFSIDAAGNINEYTDPDTKHFQAIAKMKEENVSEPYKTQQEKDKSNILNKEAWSTEHKLKRELGIEFLTTDGIITGIQDYIGSEHAAGLGLDADAPVSEWEAAMKKASKEISIGDNTAKGYEADSYYKQYKTLYELMFSLANAGVIDKTTVNGDTDGAISIYKSILASIEMNMNKQANVWTVDNNTGGVVNLTDGGDVSPGDVEYAPSE